MSTKYTIIVPAYNVEKYIEECLISIVNQTFTQYECLIIDDGSTDKTGEIARNFCECYDNFLYLKKENGGLSDARNFGMNLAKGEYIVFIDSDDLISNQFFESLEFCLVNYPDSELILVNFLKFRDIIKYPDKLEKHIDIQAITSKQLSRSPSFTWMRVAKKSLYAQINFPKGYIYEDVVVSTLLSYRANKIVEIKDKLYFYRKRDNSITTSSPENQFKLFDSIDLLRNRCIELNIPKIYYDTAFVNMANSIVLSLLRIKSNKIFFEKLKYSWSKYSTIDLFSGIICYSSLRFKILFILIKLGWFGVPFYYVLKLITKVLKKL